MPDWKHLWGCPSKNLAGTITADTDTTAADALQLATDRPTWRTVAMAARLRAQ